MTPKPEKVITCPKCGATSGDSWGQCEKFCPMPMSPHYDEDLPTETLKAALEAFFA